MVLGLIGLVAIVGVIGYGAYKLFTSITFKQTTERYRYEETIDLDGNIIDKVVDLTDKEDK